MKLLKQSHVVLILCAVVAIMADVYPNNRSYSSENMAQQDPSSLDRRISMLEQRFYMLESNLNRLQQLAVSQGSAVSQTRARDQEVNQMAEEIRRLNLRISEIECGLIKLDERTTRRSDSVKPSDPCRSNPSSPVRLTHRP